MTKKRTFTRQQKPKPESVTVDPKKQTQPVPATRNLSLRIPTPTKPADIKPAPNRSKFKIGMLILLAFIGIVIALSLTLWWYISEFEQASGAKAGKLFNEFNAGSIDSLFSTQPEFNLLILGTDTYTNQNNPALTDTIMLLSLKQNGQLYLLALPRDIWIASLQTKINAVYYYGEESEDTTGPELVKSVIKEITGKDVNRYVVLNLDSVRDLVNLLGGITVTVDRSFTDERYPSESAATDSATYTTVSFNAGTQRLDGERVLQFIRSRQSADLQEGTDQARLQRQRKVLEAFSQEFIQASLLSQPKLLGQLYQLWQTLVATDLADRELVAIGRFFSQNPQKVQLELPIASTAQSGLLINPPLEKYDQWVFEPTDSNWESVRQWLAQQGL